MKFLSLIKNKYLLARTTNIYPKAKLEMKVPTNAYDKQAPIFLKKFFLKPHEMIVNCDIELQRRKCGEKESQKKRTSGLPMISP